MSPATPYGRSNTRLLLAMIGASALVLSLFMSARPALAAEGNIAIFKTMCDSIGKQDTCNGRDDSLEDWHIDYQVHEGDENGTVVQTIVVTLGENAGGGGNTGGGSQGRMEGSALPGGDYTVCEIPIAYNDAVPRDEVPLDVLARPEAAGGGSTGGNQTQVGDDCIHFTLGTGTEELKYLDQQLEPEGTGSIEILKTDDGDPAAPLAGAEFTVEGVDGTFTTADDGTFCVDGLEMQSTATVTETAAPAGHELADPASQAVTVTVEGMCDEREGGPDATFVNPAIVEPPTPSLVIDKVADTETITISGDTASPSVVTWTLTYTLTNGPVTNAVITDEVPDGFTFLDASDGGTFAGGEVTWALPSPLTASGSVSFRTTVDVATISRTAPTTNTAVIDSDETEPDNGQDSVTVASAGTAGGNPTPAPSGGVPDTAMTAVGEVVQMPVTWISLVFIAALALMFMARVAQRR